ncbi:Cartilage intermediate layer protein 2 [Merluccius polli]|uniref:Cartilage intermediate layer protein 2 n=1 Tax=Merluccius polli TaxID=89951 RepID=A0AA47M7Y0_MERPO|nr:Cartilage intermediate layer protein 2 [Merluccius polli]
MPLPQKAGCWTEWFDGDDPSGMGDQETLHNLREENLGKICPDPQGIEVMTTSGISMVAAGEMIAFADSTTGFICKNEDQPDKECFDYRVRFSYRSATDPVISWTEWFDRDNPSATGDWENTINLKKDYPGVICEIPLYVEAVTIDTMTPAMATGQNILIFNPTDGFVCRNADQQNQQCFDYKIDPKI